MNKPKLYIHGSYIGNTGYNQHTRDFFREFEKNKKEHLNLISIEEFNNMF